jgi:hypothetical protein
MPDWNIKATITVRGIGNIAPQQKLCKMTVTADDIPSACAAVKAGLVTIKILSVQADNPADPALADEAV